MAVKTYEITFHAPGYCHLEDVTVAVQDRIGESGLANGIACVALVGSTGGVSTLEFEPGLLKDVPAFMEKLLPSDAPYHHDETWHDGNGFSHMRSFLMKTSLTVPFSDGRLVLGTWQQIVVANFDNRPRTRRVVIQLVGE